MSEFTLEDFRHRAWQAGRASDGEEAGDYLFNHDVEDYIRKRAVTEASVLIGVFEGDDGPRMLLTERNPNMRAHSGQIAFPGGRVDTEDASVEAAAVRECLEETGIGGEHIEIVGRLPLYLSGSGYRVHPILAVVHPGYTLNPSPDEVAAIFDVPLNFVMDEANHRKASREWQGARRFFYEMPYENWYIWGMTAGIIRVMYERLYR